MHADKFNQSVQGCAIMNKTGQGKRLASLALACGVLLGYWHGAQAAPFGPHHGRTRGDVSVFRERDLHIWRGGHWYHGSHGGYSGWWWIVGGVYYWYPAPVYPYPDPYVPSSTMERQPDAGSPVSAASQAGTWYYCDSAKAYYPYVSDCPSGWRPVPAAPAAPSQ
jgi:hypothetical protein